MRASRTPCSSAVRPTSHARRRPSRSCVEAATRATWRPRPASWAPTWFTCTTCCRCPGRAASRRPAQRAPPCSCTSTTCVSSARSAWPPATAAPASAATTATRCPGLVLNCRGSLPEAAVYAAALARHQPTVFEAVDRFVVPSGYAAGQSALTGRAGRPARGAAALPAGRGVRRAHAGPIRAATRSWRPGSRPRRASMPPSRPRRRPASRCGWRGRARRRPS